jgi:hypothetical protein
LEIKAKARKLITVSVKIFAKRLKKHVLSSSLLKIFRRSMPRLMTWRKVPTGIYTQFVRHSYR